MELHNLYSSSRVTRVIKLRMRQAGKVACMGEMKNAYILLAKPEGKRSLGRPRCRYEDNIILTFKELECGGMHWIHVTQDRV